MAYYCYKELRDTLMAHNRLDEYGDPIDKETHGDSLTVCYDGNIHSIAAEFIQELVEENRKLKEEAAK